MFMISQIRLIKYYGTFLQSVPATFTQLFYNTYVFYDCVNVINNKYDLQKKRMIHNLDRT